MLLTSGQISVAISSGIGKSVQTSSEIRCPNPPIVFIFTSLLFLSGYVLQQQTVQSLQAAIHPKILPPSSPTINPVLVKHFGQPPGHSFYDKYLASNRPKGGWAKVAYVQLVREHIHLCNAVMLFAELELQESMAQRIILYPSEWDIPPSASTPIDPKTETSRRLLRSVAKQYRVMLQPVESDPQTSNNTPEERYPLTTLLTLHHYTRLLYLPPSGLLLAATPLDLLFTLPMSTPLLAFASPQHHQPALLLLQPSKETYTQTLSTLPEGAYPDTDFYSLVPTSPFPAPDADAMPLIADTAELRSADAAFNATAFWEETAYVRFEDGGVRGPEWDSARGEVEAAMPKEEGARSVWVGARERFREARAGVCGLDLEPVERFGGEDGGVELR